MNDTQEKLEARVREIPLAERLRLCREMVGEMCSERGPPKMTIPVQWYDEDFFIGVTIEDAIRKLRGE